MKIKTIFNIVKNTDWKHSFRKFRNTIMVFFLIPVLIFDIVLSAVYAQKIINETKNKIDIAYLRTSMQIEKQFEMINNSFDRISQNMSVKKILISDIARMNGIEATVAGGETNKLISEAIKTISNINSVGIYSIRNNYLISSAQSRYMEGDIPKWYKIFNYGKKSDFIYSTDGSVIVCHGINIEDELAGLLIYELDKELVLSDLRFEDYKLDIGMVLKNTDGDTILEYGNISDTSKSDMIYDLNNESVTMTFGEGTENIKSIFKTIIFYSLLYLIIGIAAVYVLSFLCSIYLYDSLSNVLSKVDTFENKKVSNIKIMNNNLLDSLKNSDSIEEKLAESLNDLHEAQLSALQMQINPHFVFNVLNYANSVILEITKCDNDAVRIIVLLCEIFEFAMEEPKYMTTVDQEIGIAEKYIEIERIKTGLDFETVFEVDDELRNRICPKMFMQPIIENSVMHGLKRAKERNGLIVVSVKEINDCMEFCVTDNGKGMTSEKLAEIKEQLKSTFEDYSKHIGIRNVNQRIKLIYGKEYGLDINSDENGTEVKIRIPKDKKLK